MEQFKISDYLLIVRPASSRALATFSLALLTRRTPLLRWTDKKLLVAGSRLMSTLSLPLPVEAVVDLEAVAVVAVASTAVVAEAVAASVVAVAVADSILAVVVDVEVVVEVAVDLITSPVCLSIPVLEAPERK